MAKAEGWADTSTPAQPWVQLQRSLPGWEETMSQLGLFLPLLAQLPIRVEGDTHSLPPGWTGPLGLLDDSSQQPLDPDWALGRKKKGRALGCRLLGSIQVNHWYLFIYGCIRSYFQASLQLWCSDSRAHSLRSCSKQPLKQLTGLAATQHVGSQFPNQGSNPHPLQWEVNS